MIDSTGEALRPYLDPEIAALFSTTLYDALEGALLFAGGVVPLSEAAAQ
jgi:hypothetical protein